MIEYNVPQVAIFEYFGVRGSVSLPVPNSPESRIRDEQIRSSRHLIATIEVNPELLQDINLNDEARKGREHIGYVLGDIVSNK